MSETMNTPVETISLLGGAVFARISPARTRVGGITLLDVAVGRGEAVLATFEVTLFRGRVAPKQLTGGRVPAAVEGALVAHLETLPEVAGWR